MISTSYIEIGLTSTYLLSFYIYILYILLFIIPYYYIFYFSFFTNNTKISK